MCGAKKLRCHFFTCHLRSKKNIFEEFGFNAGMDEKKGAICGGSAIFLLDANPHESLLVFQQIKDSIENQVPGILVSIIFIIHFLKFLILYI